MTLRFSFNSLRLPAHVIAAREQAGLKTPNLVKSSQTLPLFSPEPAIPRVSLSESSSRRILTAIFATDIRYAICFPEDSCEVGTFSYHFLQPLILHKFQRLSSVCSIAEEMIQRDMSCRWRHGLQNLPAFAIWTFLLRLPDSESQAAAAKALRLALTFQDNSFSTLQNLDLLNGLIMKQSDAIPPNIMEALNLELAKLEQALLAKDPNMKEHLRMSHQLIQSYPESAHLLEPHEISVLISGLKAHTNIEIVKTKDSATKGSRKKITAEDI